LETLEWKDEWSAPDYEWPVTSIPDASVVDALGKGVVSRGGRANKEAHADRSIVMEFLNGAMPGTRIRKRVPRAECRRRAMVTTPIPPIDELPPGTLKVCVVCDAVHLWPSAAADLAS
jgi:hypothetical protein